MAISVPDTVVAVTDMALRTFMRSTLTTAPPNPARAMFGSTPSCVRNSLHGDPSMCAMLPDLAPHYGQKKGGAQRRRPSLFFPREEKAQKLYRPNTRNSSNRNLFSDDMIVSLSMLRLVCFSPRRTWSYSRPMLQFGAHETRCSMPSPACQPVLVSLIFCARVWAALNSACAPPHAN